MQINEKNIITSFTIARKWRNFVLPNFQPSEWWENDIFELTKSNLWNEYEIKISKSDFNADFKKVRFIDPKYKVSYYQKNCFVTDDWIKESKHDLLTDNKLGPNRFYYITLKEIVDQSMIPDFAGWYEVSIEEYCNTGKKYFFFEERKKAKLRHHQKIDSKIIEQAKDVCYYRMWDNIVKATKYKQKLDSYA